MRHAPDPSSAPIIGRRLLVIAALATGVVLSGCGASDQPPEEASGSTIADLAPDRSSATIEQPSPTPTTPSTAATSATAGAEPDPTPSTEVELAVTRPEPGGCETRPTGVQRFTTEAGGPTIAVRVVVPPDIGQDPVPAVLNWHGLGSDGAQQALLSAYEALARDEGFIAVHPTGAATDASNQNSWELAQFDSPDRDDLAMVDDLIDRLVGQYCVDPARVYSTGLSNGGFFTALLVCERADRIAAAVAVAGVSHPDGCQPTRPVPLVAFHGTADRVVPFDGGRSSLQGGPSTPALDEFFDQSMPDEFAQFAADFGCAPEPETTTVSQEVTRHDYLDCADGVPLRFYEIAGGGHTWPGSALGPLLELALGATTADVDATTDGWAFMSRFALPEE